MFPMDFLRQRSNITVPDAKGGATHRQKGHVMKVKHSQATCPYCHIAVSGSSKKTNGIRPIDKHENGCEFCNSRQKGHALKAKIYQRCYLGMIDHAAFIDHVARGTANTIFPRSCKKEQALELVRLNLSMLVEAAKRSPEICKQIRDLFFSIQR